jgi:hypothetical protein
VTFLTEKVAEVLRSHAGPDVPDVFRRVVHAELESERPVVIAANLVMFDGLPGRVRIGQFDMGGCLSWWSGWLHMAGGACSFEDGEWVRLDLDGNPVLPLFKERA